MNQEAEAPLLASYRNTIQPRRVKKLSIYYTKASLPTSGSLLEEFVESPIRNLRAAGILANHFAKFETQRPPPKILDLRKSRGGSLPPLSSPQVAFPETPKAPTSVEKPLSENFKRSEVEFVRGLKKSGFVKKLSTSWKNSSGGVHVFKRLEAEPDGMGSLSLFEVSDLAKSSLGFTGKE